MIGRHLVDIYLIAGYLVNKYVVKSRFIQQYKILLDLDIFVFII